MRMLLGRGIGAADAEDCVQEAILRAAQTEALDPLRLPGLLTTIAVNAATDLVRRDNRRTRLSPRLVAPMPGTTEELAIDRIEALRATAALDHLSPLEASVIRAAADGYPARETARLLKTSAKSVHLALFRARRHLRSVAGALAFLVRPRGSLRRGAQQVAGSAAVAAAALFLIGPFTTAPRAELAPPTPPGAVLLSGVPSPSPSPSPPVPHLTTSGRVPVASSTPHPVPVPAIPPPRQASQVILRSWVGAGGIGGPITVTRVNGDHTLLQSLVVCLQPGQLSTDPHQLGCAG